jgi:hypothetical protein
LLFDTVHVSRAHSSCASRRRRRYVFFFFFCTCCRCTCKDTCSVRCNIMTFYCCETHNPMKYVQLYG